MPRGLALRRQLEEVGGQRGEGEREGEGVEGVWRQRRSGGVEAPELRCNFVKGVDWQAGGLGGCEGWVCRPPVQGPQPSTGWGRLRQRILLGTAFVPAPLSVPARVHVLIPEVRRAGGTLNVQLGI